MLLHECVLMLSTHLHQISPVNTMTAFENWLSHSRQLWISHCRRPAQIPRNSREYSKIKSLNFKSLCCFLKRIYISVETYNSHVNLIESSKKSKCVLWILQPGSNPLPQTCHGNLQNSGACNKWTSLQPVLLLEDQKRYNKQIASDQENKCSSVGQTDTKSYDGQYWKWSLCW